MWDLDCIIYMGKCYKLPKSLNYVRKEGPQALVPARFIQDINFYQRDRCTTFTMVLGSIFAFHRHYKMTNLSKTLWEEFGKGRCNTLRTYGILTQKRTLQRLIIRGEKDRKTNLKMPHLSWPDSWPFKIWQRPHLRGERLEAELVLHRPHDQFHCQVKLKIGARLWFSRWTDDPFLHSSHGMIKPNSIDLHQGNLTFNTWTSFDFILSYTDLWITSRLTFMAFCCKGQQSFDRHLLSVWSSLILNCMLTMMFSPRRSADTCVGYPTSMTDQRSFNFWALKEFLLNTVTYATCGGTTLWSRKETQPLWTFWTVTMSKSLLVTQTCRNSVFRSRTLPSRTMLPLRMGQEMPVASFKDRSLNFDKLSMVLANKLKSLSSKQIPVSSILLELALRDRPDYQPLLGLLSTVIFIQKITDVLLDSLRPMPSSNVRKKEEWLILKRGTFITNNVDIAENRDPWNFMTTLNIGRRKFSHCGTSLESRRPTLFYMSSNPHHHARDSNAYWRMSLSSKLPNPIWMSASSPLKPRTTAAHPSSMKPTHYQIGWDATWSSGKPNLRYSARPGFALSAWELSPLGWSTLRRSPAQSASLSTFDQLFSMLTNRTPRNLCSVPTRDGANLPLLKQDRTSLPLLQDVRARPLSSIRMHRPSTLQHLSLDMCPKISRISIMRGNRRHLVGRGKVLLLLSLHGSWTSTIWLFIIAKFRVLYVCTTILSSGKPIFAKHGENLLSLVPPLWSMSWSHILRTWTTHMSWSFKTLWTPSLQAWSLDMMTRQITLDQFFSLRWPHQRRFIMINFSWPWV